MREEFFANYGEWFVEPYCAKHRDDFIATSTNGEEWDPSSLPCCLERKRYDGRTPGKFKEEFRGADMVALNSKTYFCRKDETDLDREFPEPPDETDERKKIRLAKRDKCARKYSSKGLSKKNNRLTYEDYSSVLATKRRVVGTNKGFVKKNNVTYTYSQRKTGLTYFYAKRKVHEDGVTTTYLDI